MTGGRGWKARSFRWRAPCTRTASELNDRTTTATRCAAGMNGSSTGPNGALFYVLKLPLNFDRVAKASILDNSINWSRKRRR